jgi:hypothetical protein
MQASTQIRDSISRVVALRQKVVDQPVLAQALHTVKHMQAQRFSGTYQDLLHSASYAACANFFLEELYSAKDFAERDAQFARIAGALERSFPGQVVATAVALAELHNLTEELDLAMALNWQLQPGFSPTHAYVLAWRAVGRREDRLWQIKTVLDIGQELGQLTRKPGLNFMLKMSANQRSWPDWARCKTSWSPASSTLPTWPATRAPSAVFWTPSRHVNRPCLTACSMPLLRIAWLN